MYMKSTNRCVLVQRTVLEGESNLENKKKRSVVQITSNKDSSTCLI